jgi:hypothetical protein
MKYREDYSKANTKRYGGRVYHDYYYYCTGTTRHVCTGGKNGLRAFVNEQVPNGQFGLLLMLLGAWDDDALAYLKEEYARQEREDSGADDYLDYEERRAKLQERRTRVNDMYELGKIDRADYLARLDEIRRLESELVKPTVVNQGVAHLLQAVRQIDTLATQWEHLASEPITRRKIAHALVAPHGLFYDGITRRIVGVRPLPDFYDAFRCTLLREEWVEQDGAFWHDSYDLPAPSPYRVHYQEVIDFLSASRQARTVAEVAEHACHTTKHAGRLLIRLFHAGYVTRAQLVEGTTRKYLYRVSDKPYRGESMARWEHLTG